MRIIPAIDIIDGKCVRLTKGDFNTKKVYNENPLEVAKQFEDNGIQFLHLVDLDGAKSKHIVNYNVLAEIASKTNLKIDFGGGLKSDEDLKIAFESGANQITGGSIAVKNPEMFMSWLKKYGTNKIILGADCKDRKIATQGWQETSFIDVIDFITDYEEIGIKNVICTDVAKDGMLQGTSNTLYKEILQKTDVNLIASGGVSSLEDLQKLKEIGCEGVIIGKAIYEGKITLKQLQKLC
ncbi:1-(5-phosphoribosyl)-5-[(5-phosphoribosylamino)methylideneamino]imidazole-4-carboxamide isomerase [Tenacibaculum sp. IB213877]|uniref:1-(5-phosphoribosyl)-5-[(5- phosphoribosylamino)methylideneamino]imidazole-4- carboxamide isomerase n=1 Tax=Tenacibaculum sp. IB213877 TaxID=3097351 RepID=UPI002A5AF399|nr:1-(5-phosphoribosyl)-5-[(5-phosphoribosylamino)methylideneamino]imidazole-4-carboxamide isomerase [Tenacibaculum sp. IB213877]MDY0779556.1 1-(5-phosphoribosyl)-5-[(5-phosphoribosylamino)methylideneamino]imidazole-4-carboxamide isomerase [Tenacibaculum sp. IB213877]